MTTIIAIVILFCIAALLPFLERYMDNLKKPIFIILGVMMILVAGFREVGF